MDLRSLVVVTQVAELFYRYSRLPRNDLAIGDTVEAIIEELGYLALAITLAATYVETRGCSPTSRRTSLGTDSGGTSSSGKRLVHQYSESVLTT